MTTPTQGEHAQTELSNEALRLASWLDCTRGDTWPSYVPQEAAAELRRLHAQVAALTAATAAPKVALELPAGDTRTANVYWSEMRGDTLHLCISVDTPAQPAAPQGVAYAGLPEPYSNIYPMNDEGFHGVCFTPAFQPGHGRPNHQPVFTADDMRDFADRTHDLRASNGQAPAAGAVAGPAKWPTTCDGKEQEAWETWAQTERYDMTQHPLHYLFLNERSYAARQGWKAGLLYAVEQMKAAAPTPAAQADSTREAPSAMQSLTAALKADPEYVWAWHCNLAMPIMDNAKVSHRVANIAAARLMQHLFGIDTEKHPHFEVADEAPQADSQPAPQGETNVQLDIDSNPSTPGQHRDMAGSVALGQPMGNGQDQAAGHSGAQGDKLLIVAERNIRSFLRSAVFKSESDREAALSCVDVLYDAARAQADSVLEDAASAGFFLQLPQRPKPEAPAGTVGLDWDAYSGTQMLAYGRDCSNAAIVAAQKPGGL